MALSLTAEQRDILKIFKIEEQYVIPAYQRPYSWRYDECFQLYNDLMEAFDLNEDYFVGNIIIAKSDSEKRFLEIIDGQQRLTTLLLTIKVLYLIQPELKVLGKILEQEDWEGNNSIPRIKSDIFEAKDGNDLIAVLEFNYESLSKRLEECKDRHGNYSERNAKNRFEANILYFFDWFSYYKSKKENLKEFTIFLLTRVFMLPIELSGKTQEEANEKALIIFETINNRGMNLEDADIFKAKLYKKAKKLNEEEIFIESWIDFKNNCEELNLEIDYVFRYYSHIIRGKEGIISSEINLRNFFTRELYSPFEVKKYSDILSDLFRILEILEWIDKKKTEQTELAKWLQLIEAYTNRYPNFAIVSYLFINDKSEEERFITFLRRLVRYVYFQGSTTRVKFEIFNIIKQISSGNEISNYFEELRIDYFDYLGGLKHGYALLAFYQDRPNAIPKYSIDKILNLNDKNNLPVDWADIDLDKATGSLGNYLVLDIPRKKMPFIKKYEYYKKSDLENIKTLFDGEFNYSKFLKRDQLLKEKLINFFKGE